MKAMKAGREDPRAGLPPGSVGRRRRRQPDLEGQIRELRAWKRITGAFGPPIHPAGRRIGNINGAEDNRTPRLARPHETVALKFWIIAGKHVGKGVYDALLLIDSIRAQVHPSILHRLCDGLVVAFAEHC